MEMKPCGAKHFFMPRPFLQCLCYNMCRRKSGKAQIINPAGTQRGVSCSFVHFLDFKTVKPFGHGILRYKEHFSKKGEENLLASTSHAVL